jgi:hypothetical protein
MNNFKNILLIIIMSTQILNAQNKKADYLQYIKDAAEIGLKEYPDVINKWKEAQTSHILWGYDAPGQPVYLADVLGFLYKETKEKKYAEDAAKLLYEYGDLTKYFSKDAARKRIEYKDGVPALSNFFYMPMYCRSYQRIKDANILTKAKKDKIEKEIAFSVDFIFHHPEWGAHNRAMLRAFAFYTAYLTLPDHPNAIKWKKMAEYIANDNLYQWEIEDASVYHPVWLHAMFNYAEISGNESLFESPLMKYYMDYYLQMISPRGNFVDFGDGVWNNGWDRLVPIYEKAATVYKNPFYKYAAQALLKNATETFKKLHKSQPSPVNRTHDVVSYGVVAASAFTDAYHWADDNIEPKKPSDLSREVLEDLVGKKIVFRNGWDPSCTYMLFNYQDEGNGGFIHKNYLRNSITVEEEKMHHGHSDENSIVILVNDSCLLLHDGGYRSGLPSGKWGAYRADYFHNRLVGRKDRRDKDQPIFDFIKTSGAYREVHTQKIDFLKFKYVDISRTRLVDNLIGYSNDRVVIYFKEGDFFAVIDIVKILQNDYFTFTNLWHTESILKKDSAFFDTRYNKIQDEILPDNKSLLIYFPENIGKTIGTYNEDRHYQNENAIYQTISSNYRIGDIETFTTILYPHKSKQNLKNLVEKFKVSTTKDGKGISLEIRNGNDIEYLLIKLDLGSEILKENIRPRYTYESGKINYGDFETDAHFLHSKVKNNIIEYSSANMLKIIYKNNILMEALPNNHGLQPDGSEDKTAYTKWRMWEDEINLK